MIYDTLLIWIQLSYYHSFHPMPKISKLRSARFVTRHVTCVYTEHQSILKICIIKQFIVDYFLAL